MNCVSSIVHRNQKSDREEITIGALFGGCSPASRAADHPRKIDDLLSLYVDLIVNQQKKNHEPDNKNRLPKHRKTATTIGGGRERGVIAPFWDILGHFYPYLQSPVPVLK